MSFLQDIINKASIPFTAGYSSGYQLLPFGKKLDVLGIKPVEDGEFLDPCDCISLDITPKYVFVVHDGRVQSVDISSPDMLVDEGSTDQVKRVSTSFARGGEIVTVNFTAEYQTGAIEATIEEMPKNMQILGYTLQGERVNPNRRPRR